MPRTTRRVSNTKDLNSSQSREQSEVDKSDLDGLGNEHVHFDYIPGANISSSSSSIRKEAAALIKEKVTKNKIYREKGKTIAEGKNVRVDLQEIIKRNDGRVDHNIQVQQNGTRPTDRSTTYAFVLVSCFEDGYEHLTDDFIQTALIKSLESHGRKGVLIDVKSEQSEKLKNLAEGNVNGLKRKRPGKFREDVKGSLGRQKTPTKMQAKTREE